MEEDQVKEALRNIARTDPGLFNNLKERAEAGSPASKAEILSFSSQRRMPSQPVEDEGSFLGSLLDRVFVQDDIVQALYESDPEFYRGKQIDPEGDFISNLLPVTGGIASSIGSGLTGAATGFAVGGPPGAIAGLALGSQVPAAVGTGVGVSKGYLPEKAISLSTLGDIISNYVGDITGGYIGSDPDAYSGPKTFQELPGVPQAYGTAMDWSVDEPMLAGLGVGARLAAKGGKKAIDAALDLTKPRQPMRDALSPTKGNISEASDDLKTITKIQDSEFLDEMKKMSSAQPTSLGMTMGEKGTLRGFVHQQLNDVVRMAEAIDGKTNGFLRRMIVDPALDGIGYGSNKIGGYWQYEKDLVKKNQDLDGLLKANDMGRYTSLKGEGPTKFLKTARDAVFKKAPLYEAKSEMIVRALEAGDIDSLLKPRSLGIKYKGKEQFFGGKKVKALAEHIRKSFNDDLEAVNAIRRQLGREPLEGIGNYWPHMFKMRRLEDTFGSMVEMPKQLWDVVKKEEADVYEAAKLWRDVSPERMGSNFAHVPNLLKRTSKRTDYSRNIIDVVPKYDRAINKLIYNAIPAATIRGRIDALLKAGKITDSQHMFFNDWVEEGLLGRSTALDKALYSIPHVDKIKWLGERFSRNILLGSSTYFLNNLSSLAQVAAAVPVRDLGRAVVDASPDLAARLFKRSEKSAKILFESAAFSGDKVGMDFAAAYSKVMQNRAFTGYEEIGRDIIGKGKTYNLFSHIVDAADQFNIAVTFNSGYKAAIKRGLGHEQAVKFGDDLAFKTQAVYSSVLKPKALRSKFVSAVAPFQTWTNNLNSFVRNDLIGGRLGSLKDVKAAQREFDLLPNAERIGAIAKLAGATLAINTLYESMGLNAPYDTKSFIPFKDQFLSLAEPLTGTTYGKKDTLFIAKPLNDIRKGLGYFLFPGEDALEGIDQLNDPALRQAIKSALNLALPFGGTQVGRTAEGLADIAMNGWTPVKDSKYIYEESEDFEGIDNLIALLLGPGRTGAALETKYPEAGYYEPELGSLKGIDSLLSSMMVPPRWERQPERIEEWREE